MCIEKAITYLKKAEKDRNLVKSVGVLLVAAILLALTAAIGISQVATLFPRLDVLTEVAAATSVFVGVFIGGLILGAVLVVVMRVLGSKGKYVDGITTIAYPFLILSIGSLITALVSYIPLVAGIISFLVLLAFGALGISALFKLVMDLFKVNLITALVVILIVTTVVSLAISGSGLVSLQQVMPQLPLPLG